MNKREKTQIGNEILKDIKNQGWFPVRTGNLKRSTQGHMASLTTYQIRFNSEVAPYIDYLEQGTLPHNIPGAFGRALPFGTSGRFYGMFHPGSFKHQYFIEDNTIDEILNYFKVNYNADVKETYVR